MKTSIRNIFLGTLVITCLGAVGCDEPHASSGSTDATSADAYDLNSEENLAPPMDSVQHATAADPPMSSAPDTLK